MWTVTEKGICSITLTRGRVVSNEGMATYMHGGLGF